MPVAMEQFAKVQHEDVLSGIGHGKRGKQGISTRGGVVLALVLSMALKIWLVVAGVVPFNADEAVVALMARHILQGARPLFFYGQAYMGSLDAILIAIGFVIFGQQVWVIRLVQALLYLGTIKTTARLGEVALGSKRVGVLAAWLLAVPAVNVTLYTTATLGGYGEALLIGNMILLTALRIAKSTKSPYKHKGTSNWLCFSWGALAGLGLWVFGLTLVYSLPAGVFLLWHLWRRDGPKRDTLAPMGWVLAGGLVGALPYLWGAIRLGVGELASELGGGAIAGVGGGSGLSLVGGRLVSFLLLGTTVIFGLRPPWEVRWLAPPLLPFVLTFWVGVSVFITRRFKKGRSNRDSAGLLAGVFLVLSASFIFTPFGADPSGRYFVPLIVPLSLFAAEGVLVLGKRYPRLATGIFTLVLGYHLWGTVQTATRYPPGITTQFDAVTQIDHRYDGELMDFLREQGERQGYTNYWVAYPLAFLSDEELIFIPALPYHPDFRHTTRDNRYQPYDEVVSQADRVAYITTNHPALNDRLRDEFREVSIRWQEAQIGDYWVFYQLSGVIRPEEIGLGMSEP